MQDYPLCSGKVSYTKRLTVDLWGGKWKQWILWVISQPWLYFRSNSALSVMCSGLRKPWYMPILASFRCRIRGKMNARSQWMAGTCANYLGVISPRQTHWTYTELMALSVNRGSVLWTGAHMNLQCCLCRCWWWDVASRSPSAVRLLALSLFRVSSTSINFMSMTMEQVANLPWAKIALIKNYT